MVSKTKQVKLQTDPPYSEAFETSSFKNSQNKRSYSVPTFKEMVHTLSVARAEEAKIRSVELQQYWSREDWLLKDPAPIDTFCKKYVNIRYTLNRPLIFGSVEVFENIFKF